ncbi:carbohydrate ABC transporter substrate-binding protein (CUT1 family) [Paenibacillus taihuensis]|uniref:Carbohydrate ABC transporter substrate-binding protein (CUT1 family) n=1 Tax=Paenibacillus taihuensis TaxID=1156355 RepID=A0A3D9RWJ8_9BACL|nr:ABC transporter substrate-binding protein [Paenibacillus taihuensis]REE81002.1 carbohydrate ABC transporter substrate-binding protein (CUT1 family) [Paenibacillus taihuensis]
MQGNKEQSARRFTRRSWLHLGAIMAILGGLLSGCGGHDEEQEAQPSKAAAIRIDYWTPFSGGDNQFMTAMVNRFNEEQTGIQIVQTNSRLDDYYSRLRTAILAGNAPDVAIVHTTSMPQFVQNGYIEDLTAPAAEVGLDWKQFNPNILASTVYNGHSFAVPLDTHALVMYYNKAYLRQAGLLDDADKPVIGQGPEGFHAFLQQIKKSVPSDVAPLAEPSTRIDSVWLWWSLYNQMKGGGAMYSADGTKAAFDNPKSLQALKFIHQLNSEGLIPPNINDSFKLFSDGKAAVLFLGMWATGALEHVKGLDFGVIPVPKLYDQPSAWGDSHTLAIPKKSDMSDEKQKAIMTFIKWMVEHGEMWAEAGHVPSMTKVVKDKAFNELKYRSDYAAVANYVAYWPRNVKQWSIIEILIGEFEKMNYNQQTPEQALRKAADKVNAALRTNA